MQTWVARPPLAVSTSTWTAYPPLYVTWQRFAEGCQQPSRPWSPKCATHRSGGWSLPGAGAGEQGTGGKVLCGLAVPGGPLGEGPPAAGTQARLRVFAFHSPSLTTTTRSPAKAPAHHAEIQKVFDHVSGLFIYLFK